ncbi:TPA: hypothetical protein ACPZOD_004070 [Yersinia enterocolitica]|nr:hypothetical protein [Yersinia enterocolitica]HDM9013924.1 hypothetical protein [Yersinia enterocolitica]HEG1275420.1 hypothetical protein [Yersinia enterocolitica]
MADENTGLVVIDIKPEQAPVLYVPNGLEDYLNHIRELAKEVPDVTTKKGRERIGSLARSVGVSKKAIENPGRAYLKQLKELVKPAEEELKRFVDACDDISKSILKPRVEWDAEQERIAEANQMLEWHEEALEMNTAVDKAMAERFESDHEMALLMNDAFDRAQDDKKAEDERLQKERDDRIAAEAAAKVKRDADLAAQQEREASARREAELKLQAEQAERDRAALVLKAEQDKKDAIAKAEREKQEAIAAEKLKAQQEADRIQREAKQKEDARLAEEKRVADEAAKKAADKAHQAEVNNAAIAILTKAGIDAECAKACVIAIIKNQLAQSFLNQQPPIQINY